MSLPDRRRALSGLLAWAVTFSVCPLPAVQAAASATLRPRAIRNDPGVSFQLEDDLTGATMEGTDEEFGDWSATEGLESAVESFRQEITEAIFGLTGSRTDAFRHVVGHPPSIEAWIRILRARGVEQATLQSLIQDLASDLDHFYDLQADAVDIFDTFQPVDQLTPKALMLNALSDTSEPELPDLIRLLAQMSSLPSEQRTALIWPLDRLRRKAIRLTQWDLRHRFPGRERLFLLRNEPILLDLAARTHTAHENFYVTDRFAYSLQGSGNRTISEYEVPRKRVKSSYEVAWRLTGRPEQEYILAQGELRVRHRFHLPSQQGVYNPLAQSYTVTGGLMTDLDRAGASLGGEAPIGWPAEVEAAWNGEGSSERDPNRQIVWPLYDIYAVPSRLTPGSVLELGAGAGNQSILLALEGFGPVVGLDGAAVQIQRARALRDGLERQLVREPDSTGREPAYRLTSMIQDLDAPWDPTKGKEGVPRLIDVRSPRAFSEAEMLRAKGQTVFLPGQLGDPEVTDRLTELFGRFDNLVAASFHYYLNPLTMFTEANRLLKPGGTLLMVAQPAQHLDKHLVRMREDGERIDAKWGWDHLPIGMDPFEMSRHRLASVRQFAEAMGFELLDRAINLQDQATYYEFRKISEYDRRRLHDLVASSPGADRTTAEQFYRQRIEEHLDTLARLADLMEAHSRFLSRYLRAEIDILRASSQRWRMAAMPPWSPPSELTQIESLREWYLDLLSNPEKIADVLASEDEIADRAGASLGGEETHRTRLDLDGLTHEEHLTRVDAALGTGAFDTAADHLRRALGLFVEDEQRREAGTDHQRLMEIVSPLITRIEEANGPELAFLEEFFRQLRSRGDIPRIDAVTGLAKALIDRRRTAGLAGLDDTVRLTRRIRAELVFLEQLQDRFGDGLLSGYQRRIFQQASNSLTSGQGPREEIAQPLTDVFESIRHAVLLEGGTMALPETRRKIFRPTFEATQRELSRAIREDIAGAEIVQASDGGLLVAQYHRDAAVTEPYFAVAIHPSGLPMRMVIKDRTRRSAKDHISHLRGNQLLEAIHAPTAWVIEGSRYDYIREIRGTDMVDFLNILPRQDHEIRAKFFYALGIAMSEAHILGMEDRAHNLIVSGRRLSEAPLEELVVLHQRAIMNIDRENALTPAYLDPEVEPRDDVEEPASALIRMANFVVPEHQAIFVEHLDQYLLGIRSGYRDTQAFFRANRDVVTDQVLDRAGPQFGPEILKRLALEPAELERLIGNIHRRLVTELEGMQRARRRNADAAVLEALSRELDLAPIDSTLQQRLSTQEATDESG